MSGTAPIMLSLALLATLTGSGCLRAGHKIGRVSDETLARDAQSLGPLLGKARLPDALRLLEAYLAHFRGRSRERDRAICRWLEATGLTPTAAAARLSALRPPSRRRMRAFLAELLRPRTCRKPREAPSDDASVRPGIYAFSETKTSLSGDTLTVQERWLLRRKGERVWGWYIRRLDRKSGDGRPYRCSSSTSYGVLMAFTFEGKPRGAGFVLEEREAFVSPGPCAPRQIRLDRCTLRGHGRGLALRCGSERFLSRVAGLWGPGMGGGHYRWVGPTTPRPDGTRQRVTEQWNLLELAGKLHGFYIREKKITARRGQRHRCNGKTQLTRRRLYLVRGTREGSKVALQEVAVLYRPGPCAQGDRARLDSYKGTLSAGLLTLSWGQGSQTLRRDATIPSLALPLRWVPKALAPRR